MPDVFLQCMCVSRGSSTREQENPEVREGVGIANQFGPISFSHKFTTSSSSYSSSIAEQDHNTSKKLLDPHRASSIPVCQNIIAMAKPTGITTGHREEYPFGHSPPTTIPWQASSSFPHRNLATVEHFSPPILFTTGIHFPPILLHNQGYPKVCPDPLNLPNAGDPFARTSSFSSYSLFSLTRDLIASI
jgi:hypothetical protein